MALSRTLIAATVLLTVGAVPAMAQSRASAPARSSSGEVTAAMAELQRGNADAAIARMDAAISGGKLSGRALGEAHRTRAAAYLANGNYAESFKDIQAAAPLLPNEASIPTLRCQLFIRRGLVANARNEANTALARDSRNAEAYACRGAFNVVAQDFDKAIADFDAAIRNGLVTPATYNSRGVAHAFKGNYAAAIADFDQAVSRGSAASASDRAEWLVNRARARSALGQFDAALRDASDAIALEAPTSLRQGDWYAARGRINAQAGRTDAAIADLTQSLSLGAQAPAQMRSPWLEDRARIYAQAGQYEPAVQDITEAINNTDGIQPGQIAEWRTLRARILVAQGQPDRALGDLDEALRLRPGNPTVLTERGMLKLRRDPAGAKADLDLALQKAPGMPEAMIGQAWLAAERSDYAGAIAAADQVVAGMSNNDLAYQLRATFRFLAGQYDAAVQDFDAAIQRDPNNPQAPAWRAMTLARAGRPEGVVAATGAWPAPVLAMFAGAADPATVEAAAKAADAGHGRGHECEAQFFIGEMWLMRGDRSRARTAFERAVATGVDTAPEHAASRYELAALRRR